MNLCPGREQLDRLLDNQLNDPEREAVETHIEGCAACQQVVRELGGDTADYRGPVFPPEGPRLAPGLLRRMEQALDDRAAALLAAPAADLSCTEALGGHIGPYKLLQQIGEGGMGTVFMAEQAHPVQRKVALKIIKPGMDGGQVVARFEAERQALSMMDHVNIARVLDAGATEAGRPYFVMELVHGVPMTKYCDDNRLTPRERLELFVPVCQAIQHAHQKGIIHRDVKPSNVMITLYDGKPVPKVIDFGVAKAIEQRLTERTLFTHYGTMVGTPEYMSPEQAEMSALGVDTRSDIFSLGVLLYELLTGSTPLSPKRVREAAYGEVLRMIKEEEPPKPSVRLSDSGEALASISAQRHMEPAKLTKLVRGELDWIAMKSLEKDRNRRYETASGFAADVQRYLNDEPVQACPPSAWYRFRKFARRNKVGVAISGLILLFLMLLVGGVGWVARDRAVRQRETERGATAALAQAEVFLAEGDKQLDNPARWQATAALATSAVQRAEDLLATGDVTEDLAARVRRVREAVDAARTDSQLLGELERIQIEKTAVTKESHYDMARVAPRYAAVLRGYGVDPWAPEEAAARVRGSRLREALVAALEDWWLVTTDAAERQRLEAVLRAAEPAPDAFRARWRAAGRRLDGAALVQMAGEPWVQGLPATAALNLARDLKSVNESPAAERLLRAWQERYPSNFWLNHDLGMVLLEQKPPRAEEAVRYLTAALALRSDSPGVYINLGNALKAKGALEGAIRSYQQALQIDPKFAMAHCNLGITLLDKGDREGAIRCYQAAIQFDPKFAPAHHNLGFALAAKGDREGAIRCYQAAIQFDPKFAPAHHNLGLALAAKGDHDGAMRELETAVQIDPKCADARNNLGAALAEKGDINGAIREFQAALEIEPKLASAHTNMGNALSAKGDIDGAIRCYQAALQIDPKFATAHTNLGCALLDKGDIDGAIRCHRTALQIDPKLAVAHNNMGNALSAKGDQEGAIREFQAAIQIDSKFALPHNNLGAALYAKGDIDGAIRCDQTALQIDPKYAMAHTNLGAALYVKGDIEGAIRCHRAALEIDPKFARAHNNLGNALSAKGDHEGAIRELETAVQIDPKYAAAHNNLGAALLAKGDIDRAIRCFQAALQIDPKYTDTRNNLGAALLAKGDIDRAIRCFQAALQIDPKDAWAHCNLGLARMRQGRFTEALVALKTGHDFESKRAGWPYPSAAWIRQTERLVQLDARLPKVLSAESQPADAAERLELAWLCQQPYKQLNAAAARFSADAFALESNLADALRAGHRYNAACAAALAGCGQGKDAGKLGESERARLRQQALDWLRADLTAWRKQLESDGAKAAPVVRQQMQHWQQDSDFVGVRGLHAIAKLPEAERQAWQTLWTDVAQTFAKAGGK